MLFNYCSITFTEMTFFYLIPAKGNMQIHVLEEIIKKRLEYLHTILHNKTINYNEYVIDGSVYDNVGHYMLCLAAICEKNTDFYNFVLTTEETLFRRRLKSLSAYNIRCFVKKLLKIVRKLDVYNRDLIGPLQVLCQYLSIKHYATHITSQCHKQCSLYFIKVQFFQCLDLLSKRQVEISNGIVQIPCNKWIEYFIILFRCNLKHRLFNTDFNYLTCDPRISEIVKSLRPLLVWKSPSRDKVTNLNIDDKSNQFPPCMLNLHLQLRERHRLSHEQRFNYSLFLKDIGMPVHESVEFWKLEYSIPSKGHSCSHNWADDERKFVYGIRHMYGLEGGRKNYACRSCHQIQASKNTCEGGCPFKSFGASQLEETLRIYDFDTMSQINDLIKKKQYTKACLWYSKNKCKQKIDFNKISLNFTPVKYFILASIE